MIFVVDTREQKPYWFALSQFKTALIAGDYTTLKLLNKVHIERKSPEDWYGTIIGGHARFRREILRARDHHIKLIMVIESSRKAFVNKEFPRGDQRKIKTETLDRICATIEARYKLEFHWCADRDKAKKKVFNLLKKHEKESKEKNGRRSRRRRTT